MLPRADLSAAAVGRVESPAAIESGVDARQQAFQRSLAGMLGKAIPADILSKFADGSFLVKVAGANARMQLPASTQVGAQLSLTLVALDPRPTFEVPNQPGTQAFAEAGPELFTPAARSAPADTTTPNPALARPAVPLAEPAALPPAAAPLTGAGAASVGSSAHAAALLGKAPLIPSAQLPALDAAATPATLSEAGKILSSVLVSAAQANGNAPAALVGRTPLLDGPPQAPAAPAALAAALKDTVANSGLFYESHLAEWASGTRSRADLAQEPQMQRLPASVAADGARTPLSQASPADPASAQLVNLQLQTQEQARVVWQGQPWPGQELRWEIKRDAPEQHGGQDADSGEPAWRSSVRLRFALLGEIGARLTLSGNQVQIQIEAGDSAVADLLRRHAAALGVSLDAAGTPLASLTVRDVADAAADTGAQP
jgi:hypothetical protein